MISPLAFFIWEVWPCFVCCRVSTGRLPWWPTWASPSLIPASCGGYPFHLPLSDVYKCGFFDHVCLKSVLLNVHSHLHQPVSNHSSPEVTQERSQALLVSALHQHAHLLCGGWVAAETSRFCGSISESRGGFVLGVPALWVVAQHLLHLSEYSVCLSCTSSCPIDVACCSTASTASIIFIIWTTKVFKLVDCQTVSAFTRLVGVLFCGGCCLFVSLHRGGGTCGWTMPSGVCSSPPFCWWSWCCCGPRRTARGQSQTGIRVFWFPTFEVKLSVPVPTPQILTFSSNWRWWGRRG